MRLALVLWLSSVCAIACGGQSPQPTTTQPLRTSTPADDSADGTQLPELAQGVTRCQQLMTRLCADLGPTTETCELVRTRTAELEEGSCDAMTQHYSEVIADLRAYEARNQPLTPENFARMIAGATTTHGPANAPVTIVIFSDFQCPFCAGAATATHEVIQRYGDKVQVVFRQFPLPFHHHAHAAAEAALAAHAQGRFWPMHDLLFANQGGLDRASLTSYAQTLGLDVAAFNAALADATFSSAVDSDLALGVELGVNATPTMFVNAAKVPNASDADALAARIDAILNSPTPAPAAQ